MGLGSALSTAVSGLNVNQNAIDVIGNNLANVNTTAFKASRNEFINNFYNTISVGSTPDANTAGKNPVQIGQGSTTGSVSVDFRPGAPTQTGLSSDLFIQGNGFFVIQRGNEQVFTRDGAFRTNSNADLVTAQGLNVLGFGVDDDFNLQQAAVVPLKIPIGNLQVAQSTSRAFIDGTLNPQGNIATQPTIETTGPLSISGGGSATAGTLLRNVEVAGGNPLISDTTFQGGGTTQLTYTPRKAGRVLAPQTFTIGPATTLGDFANFISGSLGINKNITQSPTAGFTVGSNGALSFTGNLGSASDFSIQSSDFNINNNVVFTKQQQADGESIFTQFTAYDSLGSEVVVQLTAYLESLGTEESRFRVLFESPNQKLDAANLPTGFADAFDRSVGSGTLSFNALGQLETVTGNDLTVYRQLTGASSPLEFQLDVSGISALAVDRSSLAVVSQDGTPPGTLVDYNVGPNGVIQGVFDNGASRTLGQVVLARFSNNSGLVSLDNNLYRQGPNSGLPFITAPGNGVGTLLNGALELSNTDVATSFVSLLTASTAFSANSRVIATTQELFQTLLNLPRS
ncbi:flagellar hook-basal body complex protein [bacterium]|nr:flagellar hook-basal body complex protein [bacterium]